jgi:hypothetical protein
MPKSGTKHYTSLCQGIDDLKNNLSINQISSNSESFLKQLKTYRDEISKTINDENDYEFDNKSFEVSVDYYQSQMLKFEKSINKSIKGLSNRVDKCINWELDKVYQYQNINDDLELITRAIIMDFLYQGDFEEAKMLVNNSNESFDILFDHFRTLREMMKFVNDEDYTVVYKWVIKNEDLIEKVSDIKSKLNKLIYFQVLEIKSNICKVPPNGNLLMNIQDTQDSRMLLKIKDYFKLSGKHEDDGVENKMFTRLLPTHDNFDKFKIKDDVIDELIGLYNKFQPNVNNLQKESPLMKCLLAGHFALGVLLKYTTFNRRRSSSSITGVTSALSSNSGISNRRKSSVSASNNHAHLISRLRNSNTYLLSGDSNATIDDKESDEIEGDYDNNNNNVNNNTSHVIDSNILGSGEINELPVEIELPPWMGYHTIFICPILKEETTKTNRPNVLPCRHFISEQALSKLAKGLSDEIKCPYCPRRASWREAYEVKFVAL